MGFHPRLPAKVKPAKRTFRDHAALKLGASHVFSTWPPSVILRGNYALSWLLLAVMRSKPIFPSIEPWLPKAPSMVFTFCWQAWVQSPFF